MFDDTINFLPCQTRKRQHSSRGDLPTRNLHGNSLLHRCHGRDQRPITTELLRRLSIGDLAAGLGRLQEYEIHTKRAQPDLFVGAAALIHQPVPLAKQTNELQKAR